MKLMVTGAKGQLGLELMAQGRAMGHGMHGVDVEDLDITDGDQVSRMVWRIDPHVIVNAAAYTAVDNAEADAANAFAVNRDGAGHLARACARKGIVLVHVSTDYVYSGEKKGPYLEEDPPGPVGVYARSKAAGDAEVAARLKEHVIVRTAWLYGVHGHNFVKTMLRLGRENEKIRVVEDQRGCPTDAADLARAILAVADRVRQGNHRCWGIYHYCGKGSTSWYGFAGKIFEIAKKYESFRLKEIQPVPSTEYPTPARRPANSVLDCSKIEKIFGIAARPWEEGLGRMLKRLYHG